MPGDVIVQVEQWILCAPARGCSMDVTCSITRTSLELACQIVSCRPCMDFSEDSLCKLTCMHILLPTLINCNVDFTTKRHFCVQTQGSQVARCTDMTYTTLQSTTCHQILSCMRLTCSLTGNQHGIAAECEQTDSRYFEYST